MDFLLTNRLRLRLDLRKASQVNYFYQCFGREVGLQQEGVSSMKHKTGETETMLQYMDNTIRTHQYDVLHT